MSANPRCPVCSVRHRTLAPVTCCVWQAAEWVRGSGTWALIAHCNVFTVTLWQTRRDAERFRRAIDRTGCGSVCTRHHQIVRIDRTPPGPRIERRARR